MVLSKRRPSGSAERYLPDVMHALLNLDDLYELAESRLCELTCVQAKVGAGGLVAEGIALKKVLLEALDEVIAELPASGKTGMTRTILIAVREGKSITRVARENIRRCRETVQRRHWPLAALLIALRLLSKGKGLK